MTEIFYIYIQKHEPTTILRSSKDALKYRLAPLLAQKGLVGCKARHGWEQVIGHPRGG